MIPMTAKIEEATPADYNSIAEIWWTNVQSTHHFLTPEYLSQLKSLLPLYLPKLKLFVMREEQGGDPIGFIGLNDDLSKLELLFIRPEQIGKGIGKRLLEYAISLGANKLDCYEDNKGAVGFYLKHGFTVASRSELDMLGAPYPLLTLVHQ